MALPTVRAFPVFCKSKKVGTAFGTRYMLDAGRQKLFGAEGYFSHSKGAVTTRLEIQYVVPVAGVNVKFIEDTILQNDVSIGIPFAGKTHKLDMAVISNEASSNTETGRVEGTIIMEGGVPELT